MRTRIVCAALIVGVALACGGQDEVVATGVDTKGEVVSSVSAESESEVILAADYPRLRVPFTGDLDEIAERRFLRVLVAPSRTSFFFTESGPKGFDVELMRAFEKHLNKGVPASQRVRIAFVPVPYEDLLPLLKDGIGDVAAGGLTVLSSRRELVDFSDPYLRDVEEVVVHHRSVEGLRTMADLGGRIVTVRKDTSYGEHLRALADQQRSAGGPALEVREIGSYLATEDILEMVNAGIFKLTVSDRYLAEAWARVMPDLVVQTDLVVAEGGELAWAVRKETPNLLKKINEFVRMNRKGTLLGNILFTRYFERDRWLANPSEAALGPKFRSLLTLFQKYGDRYDFDWLGIAAQGYRESGLDQAKKSSAGAVGVMQIKPSTAADKNVGVTGIEDVENNIHAGVKYMAFLRNRYFSGSELAPEDKVDFTLAAYNAGPSRIITLRRKAAEQGLDPDRWMGHVELVAAREVGREPVDYVRDIRAYWVAFALLYDELTKRELERTSVLRGPGDQKE